MLGTLYKVIPPEKTHWDNDVHVGECLVFIVQKFLVIHPQQQLNMCVLCACVCVFRGSLNILHLHHGVGDESLHTVKEVGFVGRTN